MYTHTNQRRVNLQFLHFFINQMIETIKINYNSLNKLSHTAPKYLDNIVEIFFGNIARSPKYFETYH